MRKTHITFTRPDRYKETHVILGHYPHENAVSHAKNHGALHGSVTVEYLNSKGVTVPFADDQAPEWMLYLCLAACAAAFLALL